MGGRRDRRRGVKVDHRGQRKSDPRDRQSAPCPGVRDGQREAGDGHERDRDVHGASCRHARRCEAADGAGQGVIAGRDHLRNDDDDGRGARREKRENS